MTLGMLKEAQAQVLADAGLDYYNHNLDTSPEYYGEVITTRTYADRINTLSNVRKAGMKVCAGGIVGMGEGKSDRAGLLVQLANLPQQPESVPINMPKSHVRLSAGREEMNDQLQALAFMAGANSIFYCETLLTTTNPKANQDMALLNRLGIVPEKNQIHEEPHGQEETLHIKLSTAKTEHLFYDAAN